MRIRFGIGLVPLLAGCLSTPDGTTADAATNEIIDASTSLDSSDASTELIVCDETCAVGECHCGYCAEQDFACTASTLRYSTVGGVEGPCVPGPTQVTVGYQQACLRWSDGRVSCWGLNCDGQVGNQPADIDCTATPVLQLTPTLVRTAAGGPPMENVSQVEAGYLHTCARHTDGSVECWGGGYSGQLGDGVIRPQSLVPVTVVNSSMQPLTGITHLTSGGHHSCAIDSNGGAWCWGNNEYAQLGVADWPGEAMGDKRAKAVQVVSASPFNELEAGGGHTCGTHGTGPAEAVVCWGRSNLGQLGRGMPTTTASQPIEVNTIKESDGSILDQAQKVGLGNQLSCAATGLPNQLWCWGEDLNFALGTTAMPAATGSGTTAWSARLSVLDPGSVAVAEVAGGFNFACARLDNGDVYCWGGNDYGQLGRDTGTANAAPALVLQNTLDLGVGFLSVCAITSNHEVLCWGDGRGGQLGDGTQTSRPTPAPLLDVCQ